MTCKNDEKVKELSEVLSAYRFFVSQQHHIVNDAGTGLESLLSVVKLIQVKLYSCWAGSMFYREIAFNESMLIFLQIISSVELSMLLQSMKLNFVVS